MANWWELSEESVKAIASHAPAGFPTYEGNEALWATFLNRVEDEGYFEHCMVESVKTASHPDNLKGDK